MSQVFLALLSSKAKFWIFNSRRVAVDLSTSRFINLYTYLWYEHHRWFISVEYLILRQSWSKLTNFIRFYFLLLWEKNYVQRPSHLPTHPGVYFFSETLQPSNTIPTRSIFMQFYCVKQAKFQTSSYSNLETSLDYSCW
jgi:hypothetical protein